MDNESNNYLDIVFQPHKLAELITKVENRLYKMPKDIDGETLALLVQIHEELANAQDDQLRSKLFSQVRKMNDVVIRMYLGLDGVVKQGMADICGDIDDLELVESLIRVAYVENS